MNHEIISLDTAAIPGLAEGVTEKDFVCIDESASVICLRVSSLVCLDASDGVQMTHGCDTDLAVKISFEGQEVSKNFTTIYLATGETRQVVPLGIVQAPSYSGSRGMIRFWQSSQSDFSAPDAWGLACVDSAGTYILIPKSDLDPKYAPALYAGYTSDGKELNLLRYSTGRGGTLGDEMVMTPFTRT